MTSLYVTRHQIRGFSPIAAKRMKTPMPDRGARRFRMVLGDGIRGGESRSVPTVINPISKRRINLGGTISEVNMVEIMQMKREFVAPRVF
jgi:hypothetical protein